MVWLAGTEGTLAQQFSLLVFPLAFVHPSQRVSGKARIEAIHKASCDKLLRIRLQTVAILSEADRHGQSPFPESQDARFLRNSVRRA